MSTTLTEHDRTMIARDNWARPQAQWAEILRDLSPEDAAARIFGDLHCYTADRRVKGYYERRDGYAGDVLNLARALEAWKTI